MKLNKEIVFDFINKYTNSITGEEIKGVSTQYLSEKLQMQRTNISSIVNQLVKEGRIEKIQGRPVLFRIAGIGNQEQYEASCFNNLIGHDVSFKGAIQLAKAAILYPQYSLNSLIQGPESSGKSFFAKLMYLFAVENKVLEDGAPFIKVNCVDYEGSEEKLIKDLFISSVEREAITSKASKGVLFIDRIDKMNVSARLKLFEWMDEKNQDVIIICTSNNNINSSTKEVLKSRFPVTIQIQGIAERTLEEKFELIKYFITEEAIKTKRNINVNSELLHCLILYNCENRLNQLMIDIKIGCANAYAREFNMSSHELNLRMSDLPGHVKRGLLNYKHHKEIVEQLIPVNYSYTFSTESMEKTEKSLSKSHKDTVYDEIDRKAEELRNRGITEEDITMLVSVGLESQFKNYTNKLMKQKINYDKLEKIVDKRIIYLVKEFLDEASIQFNCIYPISVFYGLCLHISSTLERTNKKQNLSNQQIMDIVDKYKEKYLLSMKFSSKLEATFNARLPIDEVVFITMFIRNEENFCRKQRKPVVLVAMHGNSTATSIADVVNSLVNGDNTYSYDLSLDKNNETSYNELKNKIKEIDQGMGVIMIYDMGSLKTMAKLIEEETGIKIKMIEMAVTLVAIDCARMALSENSLEQLYRETMDSYQYVFGAVKESYSKGMEEKIIISLCTTGCGSALQIKNYIEENVELNNTRVMAYSTSDRENLLSEVNRLKKSSEILCVVGTYDPQLYGIQFVSIQQLFDTETDKLKQLLNVEYVNKDVEKDYDAIFDYLQDQIKTIDMELLKRYLPEVVNNIKEIVAGLTVDQEIGLLMHIACSMNRIITNGNIQNNNSHKESIISKYHELYIKIKDSMRVLEENFNIVFHEDEISNIITIIKKL